MRYQPNAGILKYCGTVILAAVMCVPFLGYLTLLVAIAGTYYVLYFANRLDDRLRRSGR